MQDRVRAGADHGDRASDEHHRGPERGQRERGRTRAGTSQLGGRAGTPEQPTQGTTRARRVDGFDTSSSGCRRASCLLILSSMSHLLVLMRVIPGDPTITKLGGTIRTVEPRRALRAVRHELGLDRSLPRQYVAWVGGILHGNFGKSYFSQFPVTTLITQRIGATLAARGGRDRCSDSLIAVPAALIGAIWRNRFFDAGACRASPRSAWRCRRSSAGSS